MTAETYHKSKLRTCLWFDNQGEQAAQFYVSLLPGSRIEKVYRPDPDAPALVVEFTLAGAPYMVLNGGPHYKLNPSVSISVLTKDQQETDQLWEALIAGGGSPSRCGWLIDKYGLSWQIIPEVLPTLLSSDDKAAAQRAHNAMMTMGKLDIAALQSAFNGT